MKTMNAIARTAKRKGQSIGIGCLAPMATGEQPVTVTFAEPG